MRSNYTAGERAFLWSLAGISFFGLNIAFFYGVFIEPEALRAALTNPIAAVFIIEAFLLLGTFAYLLTRWGKTRMHWAWFIVLSLLGGLAFGLPIALLWPLRRKRS